MQEICGTLTVLFDDPYLIAVYERNYDCCYEVCKIIFGGEPKDCEVYGYFLENWSRMRFGPSIRSDSRSFPKVNPKRMQREIQNN